MTTDRRRQLDEIYRSIATSPQCSELRELSNNLVWWSGNPNAQIVLIGEAPGRQEDLAGKPFVGASGKLLDELLATINLTRDDVYITNVVKYRPPKNRDPRPSEKAAMWEMLVHELTVVQSEIIVTLGRHAMDSFIGEAKIKITDLHGQPQLITIDGVDGETLRTTLIPVYHPAATMYNRALRQDLFDDFAIIPHFLTA